jgi:transcriptional regulator with PAS, ATPase and Fis domain
MICSENPRLGGLRTANKSAWVREIATALRRSNGSVPDAAQHLELSRTTLYRWIQSTRELKAVLREIRDNGGKK